MTCDLDKRVVSLSAGDVGAEAAETNPSPGFRVRLDTIMADFVAGSADAQAHQRLFLLFGEAAADLKSLGGGVHELNRKAELVGIQSAILDAASALPADDLEQCTYKMALWRHDYVRSQDEVWPRGDIVAASVFDDLLFLSGVGDARLRVPDEDEDADEALEAER